MPRATTTSDVFNAVAEPRRRALIDALSVRAEHAVGDIVSTLGWPQPDVSKHLRVLRGAGVVRVRRDGRRRLYRLNAMELKPMFDWVKIYERLWNEQFDKLDAYLARKTSKADHD